MHALHDHMIITQKKFSNVKKKLNQSTRFSFNNNLIQMHQPLSFHCRILQNLTGILNSNESPITFDVSHKRVLKELALTERNHNGKR